ncbi:MAG TPA: bifunctional ornithine acetyltransferase/N-acetylglutamate synthase, partial [Casimicrobiaceae bacterium]|nr:bifunctional ornithine acetyltransferase/N-acetylglutamate synthase [Casimicrobiaceae bacterium]
MPVNYTPSAAESLLPIPGIRLGTAAARIKNWERDDVVLIDAAPGTVAAGVFTQNAFCAAPVTVCREHLAAQHAQALDFRALAINAGNANAGTGEAGVAAAEATCVRAAQLADCSPVQVLPFSTGVIMEPLPVQRVVEGVEKAHAALRDDGWLAAARAIITTDTVPKGASRRIDVHGFPVTVTGIAKGAGMIHPDMATMLAFIATDAPIAFPVLQALVRDVADVSFNRASVDGDTSTNDSFVLAAT